MNYVDSVVQLFYGLWLCRLVLADFLLTAGVEVYFLTISFKWSRETIYCHFSRLKVVFMVVLNFWSTY